MDISKSKITFNLLNTVNYILHLLRINKKEFNSNYKIFPDTCDDGGQAPISPTALKYHNIFQHGETLKTLGEPPPIPIIKF